MALQFVVPGGCGESSQVRKIYLFELSYLIGLPGTGLAAAVFVESDAALLPPGLLLQLASNAIHKPSCARIFIVFIMVQNEFGANISYLNFSAT